jgi:hypothetical protein
MALEERRSPSNEVLVLADTLDRGDQRIDLLHFGYSLALL